MSRYLYKLRRLGIEVLCFFGLWRCRHCGLPGHDCDPRCPEFESIPGALNEQQRSRFLELLGDSSQMLAEPRVLRASDIRPQGDPIGGDEPRPIRTGDLSFEIGGGHPPLRIIDDHEAHRIDSDELAARKAELLRRWYREGLKGAFPPMEGFAGPWHEEDLAERISRGEIVYHRDDSSEWPRSGDDEGEDK